MRAATGNQRGARRGATVVEAALVLIIFLTFLFAILEFGRVMMVRHLMVNAARQGAYLAISGTNTRSEADIRGAVSRALAGRCPSNTTIQIYRADAAGNNIGVWSDAAFGEGIAVQIDADLHQLVRNLRILPDPIHLRARSILRSEGD